jgi:hypothetical protein
LQQASHKLAEAMYASASHHQQDAAGPQPEPGMGPQPEAGRPDDGTVDADFTVVDDGDKK